MSRPHPLRSRAFAAAVITAAVATAVLLGVIDVEQGEAIAAVAALWLTAGITGGILVKTGEPVVTPVSDPVANDGTPLVKAR